MKYYGIHRLSKVGEASDSTKESGSLEKKKFSELYNFTFFLLLPNFDKVKHLLCSLKYSL